MNRGQRLMIVVGVSAVALASCGKSAPAPSDSASASPSTTASAASSVSTAAPGTTAATSGNAGVVTSVDVKPPRKGIGSMRYTATITADSVVADAEKSFSKDECPADTLPPPNTRFVVVTLTVTNTGDRMNSAADKIYNSSGFKSFLRTTDGKDVTNTLYGPGLGVESKCAPKEYWDAKKKAEDDLERSSHKNDITEIKPGETFPIGVLYIPVPPSSKGLQAGWKVPSYNPNDMNGLGETDLIAVKF